MPKEHFKKAMCAVDLNFHAFFLPVVSYFGGISSRGLERALLVTRNVVPEMSFLWSYEKQRNAANTNQNVSFN
jgi:hypothetical protein